MSRESVTIERTAKQLKKLQPLFDEINAAAPGKREWERDGLLGQVYTYGMTVRYVENREVLRIQKVNHIAQKQGRQIK
jgi:hypothetical protein